MTGLKLSLELKEYIDDSHSRQWNYAFTDQIKAKQINKSSKWGQSKNLHDNKALHKLLYRYWVHLLMIEGVVRHQSPLLASCLDTNSEDTMFTIDQIKAWDVSHLRAYHWYIEMSSSELHPMSLRTASPSSQNLFSFYCHRILKPRLRRERTIN